MDNIISELISIEAQARQIARKAQDFTAEYRQKTEAAIAAIYERAAADAEARAASLREAMEVALAEAIKTINLELDKNMAVTTEVYKTKRLGVTQGIFKRITGAEETVSSEHAGL